MNNAQLHGCSFEGWQCFHCGEVFTTVGGAQDHFGTAEGTKPGCMLKVELGDERGWLMDFREKEQRIAELIALLDKAMRGLVLTQDYSMLPWIDGWEWLEACKAIAEACPELEWSKEFNERIPAPEVDDVK